MKTQTQPKQAGICYDCNPKWDRTMNYKASVLCPLHVAAPELSSELDRMIRILEMYARNPADCVERLQGCMPEACNVLAKATNGGE